jgi:uncharacterized protein
MQLDRRQFGLGLTTLAFSGIVRHDNRLLPPPSQNEVAGYGPLLPDPDNLIDLPKGFSYRVISRFGNLMDDGFAVPSAGDGMGAFPAGKGKVALVRNHELSAGDRRFSAFTTGQSHQELTAYDRLADKDAMPLPGGTSTIIYDLKSGRVEQQYLGQLAEL